ncbi:fimbrial biogenesis outer membrane usher protein [Acinetobacter sp. P1(2023)]|uniref:fimbria/pilus outer membrane usher protein n=1 Tax=unclassified Acinetobacter TaxID=196816 RepID=UPI0021CD9978|nr:MULTISPECIES: fimbria/pilus outer membrane usher protein [unclassified Acinetobacter]MCU4530184.1 fimbrial biogenesis outer membrane usher protein [Acinetobacter sp. WU_MDCI_Abxe169]MDC0842267.1 fimbrial biogenesis outer membrane usher protein [Acinetobacter sp. P1(2023)]
MAAYAENNTDVSHFSKAEFDSNFLVGNAQKIDIARFKYGNPILPGEYSLDVYVNGQWLGKRRMQFNALTPNTNAETCFTEAMLFEYGVKADVLSQKASTSSASCKALASWIDNAFYLFDSSRLRLDISIPQAVLEKNAQGYIDPHLWDRGINAAFLTYNATAYRIVNEQRENTYAFMGTNLGANLASWQFRHNGQWKWQSQSSSQSNNSSYTSTNTYVQKAFPQIHGVVTLGDYFTNSDFIDSLPYRGVNISSDDRMLPNSMVGYAPRIRGYAKTNAKVEVRQQGNLIYQTTVPPGNFEINDLYPTGFGGELQVSVIESNGVIQKFAIPYASVIEMLRPQMSRYSLTLGQFRDSNVKLTPWLIQGKYQRGINNYLTAYSSAQGTQQYFSVLLGTAFSTPIGAISFDVTHSNAEFAQLPKMAGQSYRLSYSKLFSPTHTNLTLATYRYSTENYLKLRNAILIRDLQQQNIDSFSVGKQKSEFQLTLNQALPNQWGNFYLVGSWTNYWNQSTPNKQFQLGYSNQFKDLTYSLSAINSEITQADGRAGQDTQYLASLSFPLDFKKTSLNLNSVLSEDSQILSLSGFTGSRLNYGASISSQDQGQTNLNINGNYKTNYTTIGASISYADSYQQEMLNLSGNIVAHSQGLLFGTDQAQTMVLVYAPDATGAQVGNMPGLSINKKGYAVIPYVTPYRMNDISLDPQNMSTQVELAESSLRIAPYAGSITKVQFTTKKGYALFISTTTLDGSHLPFAAQVYNQNNEVIGIVAQGSRIYLRTPLNHDRLYVKWGDKSTEKCELEYDITDQIKHNNQPIIMTKAVCK